MGNEPYILCPRCKEQEESQPYFIFYCKLFKITLKLIIMGNSFQFYDGLQLNILPTFISEILLLK